MTDIYLLSGMYLFIYLPSLSHVLLFLFQFCWGKKPKYFLEIALFIDFSELKYILCIFQNASTFSGGKGKILSE